MIRDDLIKVQHCFSLLTSQRLLLLGACLFRRPNLESPTISRHESVTSRKRRLGESAVLSSGSVGVVGFRMFPLLEERWGTLKGK